MNTLVRLHDISAQDRFQRRSKNVSNVLTPAPFRLSQAIGLSGACFGMAAVDRFTPMHQDKLKEFKWLSKVDLKPSIFQSDYESARFKLFAREEDENMDVETGEKRRPIIREILDRLALYQLADKLEYERRVKARKYLPESIKKDLWYYRYALKRRTLSNGKSGFGNYWWDRLRYGKNVANSVLMQLEGPPSIKQGQTFVTGHKSDYDWKVTKLHYLNDKYNIKKLLTGDQLKEFSVGMWLPPFAKRWVVRGIVFFMKRRLKRQIAHYESQRAMLNEVSLANTKFFKREIEAIKTQFSLNKPGKTLTVEEPVKSGSMAQAFKAKDSDDQAYIVKIVRPEAAPERLAEYVNHQYYQNLIDYGCDTLEKIYRAAKDAEYSVEILQQEADLPAEKENQHLAQQDFEEYDINSFDLYQVDAATANQPDNPDKKNRTLCRSALVSQSAGDITLKDISPDSAKRQDLYDERKQCEKNKRIATIYFNSKKKEVEKNTYKNQIVLLNKRLHEIDTKLNLANQKIAEIMSDRLVLHILGDTKQLDDTQGNYTLHSIGKYSDKIPKVDPTARLTSIDWGRTARMNQTRYCGLKTMMKQHFLLRRIDKPIAVEKLLEDVAFRNGLREYLTLPSRAKHPLAIQLSNYETALAAKEACPDNPSTTATLSDSIHHLTPLITFLLTQNNQRFQFPSKELLRNLPPLEGVPKGQDAANKNSSGNHPITAHPALLDVFYNELVFNLIPNNPDATPDDNLQDQLITNIPMPFSAVKESRTKFRGMFSEAFICPYPPQTVEHQFAAEMFKTFFATASSQRMSLSSIRKGLHYPELFGQLNISLPLIQNKNYEQIPVTINAMLKAMSTNDEAEFDKHRQALLSTAKDLGPPKEGILIDIYAHLIEIIPVIDSRLYAVARQLTAKWLKGDEVSDENREQFERNVAQAIFYDLQDEIYSAGRAKIMTYLKALIE